MLLVVAGVPVVVVVVLGVVVVVVAVGGAPNAKPFPGVTVAVVVVAVVVVVLGVVVPNENPGAGILLVVGVTFKELGTAALVFVISFFAGEDVEAFEADSDSETK